MNQQGQIISFYSYKGGVGRSMALANVAALLAQQEKKILVIDLDLEAPGLHRYFLNKTRKDRVEAKEDAAGAIEFFTDIQARLSATPEPDVRAMVEQVLDDPRYRHTIRINNPNLSPPQPSQLEFMAAGHFDAGYPERVHALDWKLFYERFGDVFSVLAEELRKRYDFILIDSRTGITDVGSVCTVLLPDKLVLAFSANEQSLYGAVQVGRQAALQKQAFAPDRPLVLFPLAGRIENAEKELQKKWLDEARRRFEEVFRGVYGNGAYDLTAYFNLVRIQHSSFYAYGEEIAAEQDAHGTTGSMAAAFHSFLTCLHSNSAKDLVDLSAAEVGTASTKTALRFIALRDAITNGRSTVKGLLADYLEQWDGSIEEVQVDPNVVGIPLDEVIYRNIAVLTRYRNEFVELLDTLCKYLDNEDVYRDALIESLQGLLRLRGSPQAATYWKNAWADHFKFFLHELFIYVIAVLIKRGRYALAARFLHHRYYREDRGGGQFSSYRAFRAYVASLDEARNRRLYDERRASVTADLIKDRATLPDYPFEDLQQADFVLLLNSVLHDVGERWYPVTLIYEQRGPFRIFSKAESSQYFAQLASLFQVDRVDELLQRYEAGKVRLLIQDEFRLTDFQSVNMRQLANLDKLNTV